MIDLFFELIRVAVGVADRLSRVPTEDEWEQLFDMANKQALVGVCMSGVEHLPYSQWPPVMLKYQWIANVSAIEDQNEILNKACVETCEWLTEAGFKCCILKGQGNGTYYKVPRLKNGTQVVEDLSLRRQSGDVDVWLTGGRSKVVAYLKRHVEIEELRYYHAAFKLNKDVEVEAHFTPGLMNNPFRNRRLQRWFETRQAAQCKNNVVLADGGVIPVPIWEFNVVYQLVHMFHHLMDEGIGLRQVMDYYFLLNQTQATCTNGENVRNRDSSETENSLRQVGLYKFACALMWVLGEVFRLPRERMIVAPNEKEGRFLLNEIVQSGNFGQGDERYGFKDSSAAKKYLQKCGRSLRIARHYPAEALCEPWFRTWHFVWRKLNGRVL